jgi:hypothetical protein
MKKLILIIFCSNFIFSCGINNNHLTDRKPYVSPPLNEKELYQWNTLCGKWYGKSNLEDNEKREWLVDRKNDGHYIIVFITIDQNGIREKTIEKGEWGLSGNIYFTIFKSQINNGEEVYADPSDPINRDSYKILKLNNNLFKYKHLRTHGKYEVIKVDETFELK